LFHAHEIEKHLYPSQLTRLKKGEKKVVFNKDQKEELDKAIINCIIKDSRPFADFAKKGMLNFLQVALPGFKPPSRTTITKSLKHKYKIYRSYLKEALSRTDHIGLTSDMWKNRSGSNFLCLTGHYLNRDFEMISFTLAFRRFYNRHTSENLSRFIINQLISLGDYLNENKNSENNNKTDF